MEIEGEEPREPDFYCRIVKNDVASVQAAIMAADVIVYSIAEGEHTAEAMAALEFIQQVNFVYFFYNSNSSRKPSISQARRPLF